MMCYLIKHKNNFTLLYFTYSLFAQKMLNRHY